MDGQTQEVQHETIIPNHRRVVGYKNDTSIHIASIAVWSTEGDNSYCFREGTFFQP